MTKTMRQTCTIMADHGFHLVRQKKHLIFRHEITRQTVALSKTPSDHRYFRQVDALLQRICSA